MNSGVRIIKRNRGNGVDSSPHGQDDNTGRQNERQIGSTIKNWIAELAQRKRADEQRAAQIFAAIHG